MIKRKNRRLHGFRGVSPVLVIKKAGKEFLDDDMTTYASALSYQVLFSIFPFIIFLIALLGFLHLSSFFDWLRGNAQLFLPQEAMGPVNQVIEELQQQKSGVLSLGVVVALWSASAAVRATINALNVAYDVRETRPAWKLYPLSLIYTVGFAALLIAAAALMTIGPQAMQWIAVQFRIEQLFVTLWAVLRWPIALLLLTLSVAVIYHVAPNVRQRFHFITPGAVLAILFWIATSLGFNFYVSNFANYSATYGSIGTIIVLLLFFFISASALLFGAEVNAVIEQHAPQAETPDGQSLSEATEPEHKKP
ncbi:YihY/virulence factor BrkB family protein [Noviherbaspirillum saxi]|uniref:YihY/virulence factor BrkB family protein n=1 Tax=Noviherbaspirillum saxi TaxID=2320863 RepID=A0A3A3FLM0_9BURK|nr:YihY/virulence factor BrkB family protein [Noviherbaspirillum saxi]RJF96074.1 YihY/virulence factor BrkB family protein [Noviherbaspirillum saxi]